MNPEERLLEKIATIVYNENRPVSFKDLLSFNWNGNNIEYTHGSLRNLISKLLRDGKIEVVCRSPQAFYTLKGVNFGKVMTPTFITGTLDLNYKQKEFLRFLNIHQLHIPAIHDIRLLFTCEGLRSSLISSNSQLIKNIDEKYNKDIQLRDITLDDITLKTTVHNTNTVTVMVACSDNPIMLDYVGLTRLSSALTRVEERLQRVLDDHYKVKSSFDQKDIGHSIPYHMSWIVTMWHFGHDSDLGFAGQQFEITWKEGLEVFRIYSKKSRYKIQTAHM